MPTLLSINGLKVPLAELREFASLLQTVIGDSTHTSYFGTSQFGISTVAPPVLGIDGTLATLCTTIDRLLGKLGTVMPVASGASLRGVTGSVGSHVASSLGECERQIDGVLEKYSSLAKTLNRAVADTHGITATQSPFAISGIGNSSLPTRKELSDYEQHLDRILAKLREANSLENGGL